MPEEGVKISLLAGTATELNEDDILVVVQNGETKICPASLLPYRKKLKDLVVDFSYQVPADRYCYPLFIESNDGMQEIFIGTEPGGADIAKAVIDEDNPLILRDIFKSGTTIYIANITTSINASFNLI